jgi:acyl-CoA synthetase (NDP forming)
MTWIEALFRPRSVAVYGSVAPGKIGRVLVDQLLDGGFTEVVAVNPKAEGTDRVPAVGSLGELPASDSPIDLAVIASPAATVPDVLGDAGEAGVQVAVIITAGFSESGDSKAEEELLRIAGQFDIRLIGPNCAGIVNTKHNLYPTLETRPPAGDVAFVSQSGALGGAVLSWAEEQGVGISKFVSYGNAIDLTEVDFLDALREDDETRVASLYVETVSDGRRFMEAVRRLVAEKPLVVIKSGRSVSGRRAALSHTGSMAGADAVFDAALRQCGAVRADGIEEMFDLCRGFTMLPPMRGRRLAIVTNSGGPGVLAADHAERHGLGVRPPSDGLRRRLRKRLPSFCGFDNPFDLTVQGTQDDYRDVLIDVLAEYDAALAINVNPPYLDSAPLARGIVTAAKATEKAIAASFMAGRPAQGALPVLRAGNVPNFVTGERAVRVLSLIAERERGAEAVNASAVGSDRAVPPSDSRELPWDRDPLEPEAMDWLEGLGLPVIKHRLCRTAEEALTARDAFDEPIAMKVVSPEILHKTDVGGVALGLSTDAVIRAAFDRLRAVAEQSFVGVLVTPMVEDAIEIIVGLTMDPQFGPIVAVGLGGIFTETLRDLSLRVAPVSEAEARTMLDELRGGDILAGARGRAPRDRDALVDLISRVSRLPFEYPGIRELDLNPIFCLKRGCAIADARVLHGVGSKDEQEGSLS